VGCRWEAVWNIGARVDPFHVSGDWPACITFV